MYGVSALKLLEAFHDGRTDQTAGVLPRLGAFHLLPQLQHCTVRRASVISISR
jgi:hypothetical protein